MDCVFHRHNKVLFDRHPDFPYRLRRFSSAGKESAYNAGDPSLIPGLERSPGEEIGYLLLYLWASLVAQLVKNLPAMWETWVWSLGWEDSPGEGKGYPLQYSGLENSMDYIIHGVARSWTWLSDFHFHLRMSKSNLMKSSKGRKERAVGKNSVIQNLKDNNWMSKLRSTWSLEFFVSLRHSSNSTSIDHLLHVRDFAKW